MKNNRTGLRYWLNITTMAVLSSLLALFVLVLYASDRWAQSHLHPLRVFPVQQLLEENEIPFQDIELTTRDGVRLSAWYTPPQNGAVILVAHGYNSSRPAVLYAMFVRHGYGVLAWDFRAHGASGGEMSTLGYFEQFDLEAALDYVLARPGVEHVGAWGGSMGAATVILAAARRTEIKAVVSDSAYPALEDLMKISVPFKGMSPYVMFFGDFHSGAQTDDVRPVDEIVNISPRPVFIIDGWEGTARLMNSPYRLYDAAKEPRQIWVEQGVPHMGMYARDPQEYEKQVTGFFDKYLINKTGSPNLRPVRTSRPERQRVSRAFYRRMKTGNLERP